MLSEEPTADFPYASQYCVGPMAMPCSGTWESECLIFQLQQWNIEGGRGGRVVVWLAWFC